MKKTIAYVIFFKFKDNDKVLRAIVKGEKEKINSKEKAIEIFAEEYNKQPNRNEIEIIEVKKNMAEAKNFNIKKAGK